MTLRTLVRGAFVPAHAAVRILLLTLSCVPVGAVAKGTILSTERARIAITEVVQGLDHPWGLAFLPDGRMLVTERPGRLRLIKDRVLSEPIEGLPAVAAVGQGGLLDVAIAPDFDRSRTIFFSYSEPRDGGSATSVARARLGERGLSAMTVIFRQQPAVDSPGHFGSRLVFARDGTLFVTLGERQARHFAIRAQDLESHFGKVVRIDADGRAPADNPFTPVPGARPEIWSYGHRNIQGAALHPQTGELWITEHGPRGGDELNIARAGTNHGWPLVTYGVAYSGERIGVGAERAGIEKPVTYWVPSIATSGLAFYSGERFKAWSGNLFAGGLYGVLVRLELDGTRVVHQERLQLKHRVRDVRQGPDGNLYLLTDSSNGKLLRIEPAASQ